MVSSLSSHRDDGYSSPRVSTESSTPVSSAPTDRQTTPQSSLNNPLAQSTPRVVENPLVKAGLVPQHLADIFVTGHADETSEKRSSRRITGVRVLTANDYVEMMREKDRKAKETAELKQKRKEERGLRKVEKEREQERKKKEREEKKQKGSGQGKGRKQQRHSSSELDECTATASEDGDKNHQTTSSRTRSVQPPQ